MHLFTPGSHAFVVLMEIIALFGLIGLGLAVDYYWSRRRLAAVPVNVTPRLATRATLAAWRPVSRRAPTVVQFRNVKIKGQVPMKGKLTTVTMTIPHHSSIVLETSARGRSSSSNRWISPASKAGRSGFIGR